MTRLKTPDTTAGLLACALAVCALCAFGCNALFRTGHGQLSPDELLSRATQLVQEALNDQDPRIRASAVEVVATTQQIELMPKVRKLLEDDYIPVRFAAVLAVADTRYTLAKKQVQRLLSDPEQSVRIAAAYCLSRLGNSRYLELLRAAAASNERTVRANAAVLLGKSGDRKALKLLYRVMRDDNSDDKTRFQAAEAIATLGDEKIYPKLWTMLISVYADDRVMGIRAMGALATAHAQNAIITMLDDPVIEVRLTAAEQLGMLGDTIGQPEVLDVFAENLTARMDPAEAERVNVLTALAIGRIRTEALTVFLPQLLEDRSKLVRLAAAKAVFQCQMHN